MKKKLFAMGLAVMLTLQCNSVFAAQAGKLTTAKLNEVTIIVDGIPTTVNSYNIDGYNYIKLRDIGKTLDYLIEWDTLLNRPWVETTKSYVYGEEETPILKDIINVKVETDIVYVNAYDRSLLSCNIDGYNYYQLRDISDLINESVQMVTDNYKNLTYRYLDLNWNMAQNAIEITTHEVAPGENISQMVPVEEVENSSVKELSVEEFQNEVVRLLNIERVNIGVQALEIDPQLMDIAMLKAKETIELSYSGHTSPVHGSPTEFAQYYGYSSGIGENIHSGFDFDTPEDVITAWMNSQKGHRENMLNDMYKYVGFGFYCGDTFMNYNTMQENSYMNSVLMLSN